MAGDPGLRLGSNWSFSRQLPVASSRGQTSSAPFLLRSDETQGLVGAQFSPQSFINNGFSLLELPAKCMGRTGGGSSPPSAGYAACGRLVDGGTGNLVGLDLRGPLNHFR